MLNYKQQGFDWLQSKTKPKTEKKFNKSPSNENGCNVERLTIRLSKTQLHKLEYRITAMDYYSTQVGQDLSPT